MVAPVRIVAVLAFALGSPLDQCALSEPGVYTAKLDQTLPEGAQLWIDGKQVGTFSNGLVREFELDAGKLITDPERKLVVKYETPCGPQELAVDPGASGWLARDEADERRKGETLWVNLDFQMKLRTVTVYLGGAGKSDVRMGTTQLSGVRSPIVVKAPLCEAGAKITADGQEVGVMPTDGKHEAYFVSVPADQCWALRTLDYVREDSEVGSLPSVPTIFRDRIFGIDQKIDYLDVDPPEKITSTEDFGELKTHLGMIDCAKADALKTD